MNTALIIDFFLLYVNVNVIEFRIRYVVAILACILIPIIKYR